MIPEEGTGAVVAADEEDDDAFPFLVESVCGVLLTVSFRTRSEVVGWSSSAMNKGSLNIIESFLYPSPSNNCRLLRTDSVEPETLSSIDFSVGVDVVIGQDI